MNMKRFQVEGDLSKDFRTDFEELIRSFAFKSEARDNQEKYGWVSVLNLLDTDFLNYNDWMMDHYIVLSLRVDKKKLPKSLYKAKCDEAIKAWCKEHGRERCPRQVKMDLKDTIEFAMYRQILATPKTFDLIWDINTKLLLFDSHSDKACDILRVLFRNTFGLQLRPLSALDMIDDQELVDALMLTTADEGSMQ